ncbi:unnamed protein product, partial [Symbiodinium necroappetens]
DCPHVARTPCHDHRHHQRADHRVLGVDHGHAASGSLGRTCGRAPARIGTQNTRQQRPVPV